MSLKTTRCLPLVTNEGQGWGILFPVEIINLVLFKLFRQFFIFFL